MKDARHQDARDHRLVRDYLATRRESAFRQLYEAHTPALYSIVQRLLGGHEADTADVIQETWLVVAQKLDTFQWRSSLSTWLAGVAINQARNRYRRRSRDIERTGGDVTEIPSPPPIEHRIDTVQLEAAVTRLPDGYREVLLLHDVEGYTHEEIGELLGINTGTSKSQLSRARATLRRWLETEENGHERRSR